MRKYSTDTWKKLALKMYLDISDTERSELPSFSEVRDALVDEGLLNSDGTENKEYSFNESLRIYVGNLPWSTQSSDLNDLFSTYGDVKSVSLVTDKDSGRSRGFAFIEFKEKEALSKVLETEEPIYLDGRQLRIGLADKRGSDLTSDSHYSRRRSRQYNSFNRR